MRDESYADTRTRWQRIKCAMLHRWKWTERLEGEAKYRSLFCPICKVERWEGINFSKAIEEAIHYAEGVADLAIKHRDAAEVKCTDLEAEIERWRLLSACAEARRVQHVTRGGFYRVVGQGKIQTTVPLEDMADVTVYISEKDGGIWIRDTTEFEDGRFLVLPKGL